MKAKGQYMRSNKTTAENLEAKFEAGGEVLDFFDTTAGKRPGKTTQRVNVDFPGWVVQSLDAEAHRLGITRQALIKVWIANQLENKTS